MSFWITTKRVARYGFIGFLRNGFVSLAAILIMTITLFVTASIIIAGAALDSTLEELMKKVDINVYFVTTATEDQVNAIQRELEALPEVASVTYTSREAAEAEFRELHKNNTSMIQALDQLTENPLGASLGIRAKQTSQYASIAAFLDTRQDTGIISLVNYHRNKSAIDRLTSLIETSRTAGLATAGILALAAVLIAFNTIRLAIYTSRDEIGVMNLVGAGHWYVRGPFMIAGILYGIVSGAIVLLLLYPLTAWLGVPSEKFFGTFNVFDYFVMNFPFLLMTTMGLGIILGSISSYLAVRRYLRG